MRAGDRALRIASSVGETSFQAPSRRFLVGAIAALIVVTAPFTAPAQRAEGVDRVWNVTRQCWQAPGAQTCGQNYDVGKRRHTGGGQARPAPRTETTGRDAKQSTPQESASKAVDSQAERLEQMRRLLEKLEDTEDGGKVLHSLGDLQANDDTDDDEAADAEAGASNPDEPDGRAGPGAPTPLEKAPE